jgi:alanyl-tRNA synthetase
VEGALRDAARLVKAAPGEVAVKVDRLLERERALEKEIASLKRELAMGGGGPQSGGGGGVGDALARAREVPGGKALALRLPVGDAATLRETAEKLRDSLGDAVVLVGAAAKDKALLVMTVSTSLVGRYHAGDLVKQIAVVVGGSGGGRPDMAQAGGTQIDKLDEALESLYARLA